MITVLLLLLAGCAGEEPLPEPEAAPAEPEPTEPTEAAAPQPSVRCPDGTQFEEVIGLNGKELFCTKDGVKHGPYLRLHAEGMRAVEGVYANNEPDGPWSWYHPTGEKAQRGSYKSGRQVGNWTWWYPNGNTQEEGDFLNGRRTGTWVAYHESGRKKEEGIYFNDMKNGTWSYYLDDEANGLERTETWASGKLQDTRKAGR